jgi:hypothetical protein
MKSRINFLLLIVILLTSCKGASTPTETVKPLPTSTQASTSTLDIIVATRVAATLTAQSAPPTPTLADTSTVTPPPPATATVTQTATPTSTTALTATPTSTDTPTPEPSPTPIQSAATGKMCYPSDSIPAMTAYFQNSTTGTVIELPIAAGQITYTITLTPGTYIAYAWLPDFSYGGLYSNAVPCGLTTSCDDHAARPFTVKASQVVHSRFPTRQDRSPYQLWEPLQVQSVTRAVPRLL